MLLHPSNRSPAGGPISPQRRITLLLLLRFRRTRRLPFEPDPSPPSPLVYCISSNHASPFPSLPTFFRLSFFRGSPPPPRLFDNPIIRPFFSARKTFLFRRFKDNRARLEAIEHPLVEIRLPTLARFSRAFQIRSFPSFPDFH